MNLKRWTLSAFAIVWLLFSITFNLELIFSSNELGDFGSFIAAGINTRNGTNPYDASSPLIFETNFPRVGAGGKQPNLNPPISLLFFAPLADSDPFQTLETWRVISFLIFITALLLLVKEYKPNFLRIFWAFALAGLWHTVGLGQIYTSVLLLSVLAWLSFRNKKEIQTGIFLGLLVSIKPNFIAWVLLLIVRKQWKTILTALGTIAICGALPLLWLPPDVYLQWIEASGVGPAVLNMPGNSSLIGLTSRMGSVEIGLILGLGLAAFTAWGLFRVRDTQTDPDHISSAGILLSLLLSPIAWVGYTILALPYFLSRKQWNTATVFAAFILTVPFNFTMYFYYYFGRMSFAFWGWWYGIALAICMISVLIALWRNQIPTQRSLSETPP